MKEKIIHDIEQYIKFLEQNGYIISLTFMPTHLKNSFLPLIQYDLHPHRICSYLKANKGTLGRCVSNKKSLIKKDIKKPYYACCYAGVEEFLFPVRYEEQLIVCIHISGFRGLLKRSSRFMKQTSTLCDERFAELYSELSEDIPSLEQVSSFTEPLSYMLKEFCKCAQLEKETDDATSNLYYKALHLLYEGEIESWSCTELSKRMNYSESYMRYVFKKAGNISLQTKINQIRLEKAKRFLKYSNEAVTQIAFSLGFSDSNYFSTYFKKHTGVSPLTYRKSNSL